jgi:parallel beta-helix repeat protein
VWVLAVAVACGGDDDGGDDGGSGSGQTDSSSGSTSGQTSSGSTSGGTGGSTSSGTGTGASTADTTGDTGTSDATTTGGGAVATCGVGNEWDDADFGTVYEVGPGQTLATPSEVPWESLQASTLVKIHWRDEPYRDKWVIATSGTADDPVVVLGIPDAGRLPVITGEDAVTRAELDFWNERRGVLKIGGSSVPSETPTHVYVENLEIRSGRAGNSFTNAGGGSETYADNAAAVYIESGVNVTIRGNEIHDSGNGIFISSDATDIVISGNYVHGNGNVGSAYEHNSYTEARGITFECNRYGALCSGCDGNNLKDRSMGTVIRYNWIEDGNRQLDLVDSGHADMVNDPSYSTTFVYGNVLVEPDGAGNSQVVHYGGDGNDTNNYRKGTLHFFHNTVVSTRSGNTTLVRLSTGEEYADIRNNVVYVTAGGDRLAIVAQDGDADLRDNWLPTGWVDSHSGGGATGNIADLGNVEGTDPGFVSLGDQDFMPAAGSELLDVAGALAAGASAHPVDRQYVEHQGDEVRPDDGSADIGAFER